jgi:phosphopantothenoylcysteine decarboxylase/phosphopantothenate--cysteine ligase
MYGNKILQKNIEVLKDFGYYFMEPDEGFLACKDEGMGRLPEPSQIFNSIMSLMERKKDLEGTKILITAGPTRENIDPVRYISNYSSGKMGYSIAECAKNRGAEVCLITGPCSLKTPNGIEVINVLSAKEMHNECMKGHEKFDIIILVAAVADYRAIEKSTNKIKKTDDELVIKFIKNPDIAKDIGTNKKDKILVGFCAETENLIENARGKMKSKNFDIIVANDVSKEGAGFDSDTNIVTIMDSAGVTKDLPMLGKYEVAEEIIDFIKEYKARVKI